MVLAANPQINPPFQFRLAVATIHVSAQGTENVEINERSFERDEEVS